MVGILAIVGNLLKDKGREHSKCVWDNIDDSMQFLILQNSDTVIFVRESSDECYLSQIFV